MFDTTVGRWLQEDPKGFDAQDPNLYRYVKNSSTNATDPSGLQETPAEIEKKFEEQPLFGIKSGIEQGTFKQDKAYLKTFDTKTPRGDALKIVVDKGYVGFTSVKIVKKDVEGTTKRFGAYVKIDFTVDTDRYDEIRIIQILRYTTIPPKGKDKVSADPINELRRNKCDWDNKDAVSPGWWVDSGQNAETFYVTGTDTSGIYTSKKQAIVWDFPSFSVEGYGRATNIGAEFYTVVIGWTKGKTPEYLGGVKWGFFIDDKQVVKFDPAVPELLKGAPKELGDALAKWNKFFAGRRMMALDDFFKAPGVNDYMGINKIEGVDIPKLEPTLKK